MTWWQYLSHLCALKRVDQARLAEAWRDHPGHAGRDPSQVSKMFDGLVKKPPKRWALYYMASALNLDLFGAEMRTLAAKCYGADKVDEVRDFWQLCQLAEAMLEATNYMGFPDFEEVRNKSHRGKQNEDTGLLWIRVMRDVLTDPDARTHFQALLDLAKQSQRQIR
jgi:hypothetical protein